MVKSLNYTPTVVQSLVESQLKFKILYFCKSLAPKNLQNLEETKPILLRMSLKIIFSLTLKKVLSSKLTNRTLSNYFKLWPYSTSTNSDVKLEKNKSLLDPNYATTLEINSLYEFYNNLRYD